MSDTIHSRPLTAEGRQNYDHIFRKTDPAHSLVPGTIREYRSDCCGADYFSSLNVGGLLRTKFICRVCGKECRPTLTKTNP